MKSEKIEIVFYKDNKGFKVPLQNKSEAIEKMAKAVCMNVMYGCESCSFGKDKEKCKEWIAFNHIADAEAALNELLGE